MAIDVIDHIQAGRQTGLDDTSQKSRKKKIGNREIQKTRVVIFT